MDRRRSIRETASMQLISSNMAAGQGAPSTMIVTQLVSFSRRLSLFKPTKFRTVVAQQSSSNGRPTQLHLHETTPPTVQRRSGNYGPDIWESHDQYPKPDAEIRRWWGDRAEELKQFVKQKFLITADDEDDMAELVDTLQRLGLGYHFQPEIQNALRTVAAADPPNGGRNLHACALRFRLLRQAGIWVSPDVFEGFREEDGKTFKEGISGDLRGLLSLYEASYLGGPGESVVDEAKNFARTHLQETYRKLKANMATSPTTLQLAKQLARALELPSHWRTQRSEARWHIEQYKDMEGIDPTVLELAMLDFNMLQLVYQTDLEELNRWWERLGLPKKLEFARDRLTESFQWAVSLIQEPEFSYCRKTMTKLTCLINVVDDVYDVYGSLDELQLFTAAIQRWDACELDLLPEYMQICFMAVYNTTNELAYQTLKQQGFHSLPYIKQAWQEQCSLYLEEAKTFHNAEVDQTSFDEYLEHGRRSIASSIILIHTYAASGETLTKEAFEYLTNYPNLTCWVATVARLTNDLATSKAELERGDVLKSVECYMSEKGVSEEEACKYIQWRIEEAWKRINKEITNFGGHMAMYVNLAVNLTRGHHFMYHHGDANGSPTEKDKDRAMKLIYHPFPIHCNGG